MVVICFSPEGDLAGGLVVTAIGVDACRHLRGRNNLLLLAALPVVLGAQGTQLGRGEPIRDTARVLAGYCDAIAYRTSSPTRLGAGSIACSTTILKR